MGLGIKTALLRPFEPIFRYRLPKLRKKYFNDTSQHGECLLLRKLIKGEFPRFIVDVGANDGLLHSNSYFFLQQGWSGILIEPHPGVFAKLQRRYAGNPEVVCVNSACSDTSGTQHLFFGADGEPAEFSTLCEDDTEAFRRTRTEESVPVSVTTLTEILEANHAPADFGILSVDTEGLDYQVLKGLDFLRFRPRIIVTESYAATDRAKSALLESRGYLLLKRRHVNTLWIDRRTS